MLKKGKIDIVEFFEDLIFQFAFPIFSIPFFSLDKKHLTNFLLKSINIPNFLGNQAMEHYEKIKRLFIDIEVYGLHPLTLLSPNLPFGPPAKCRKTRKEISELIRPFVVARRESKEELDDYLSIWTESPHVAGEKAGQEYTIEEITNQILIIIFAAHINTRKKKSALFYLAILFDSFPSSYSCDSIVDLPVDFREQITCGEDCRGGEGDQKRRKRVCSL